MTDRDIGILHDTWMERGGAEHVAVEMARTFNAPIYVAKKDDDLVPHDVEVVEVFTRWFEQAAMNRHHLIQDLCQMIAWQHIDEVYDHDTIILNKNNPGWFVPRDDQTVVKYLHSTPRQPYDLFPKTGRGYIQRLLRTLMRVLYRPNTTYPDAWVCNSELVQRRLDSYWGVPPEDSTVVYPPVETSSYSGDRSEDAGYYLTLSRLVGHKNIDEVIHAFSQLVDDYQLKIAGAGPARSELESIAGKNVEFLGYVDEAEKRQRLAEAKAFVFAAENEDFGMVPVEAMASGTPVIGVKDGFTQHQIIDGKNGRLFAPQGGHLRECIRYFETHGVEWSADRIEAFASRFSAQRFRDELTDIVDETVAAIQITPEWKQNGVEDASPYVDRTPESVALDGGGDST